MLAELQTLRQEGSREYDDYAAVYAKMSSLVMSDEKPSDAELVNLLMDLREYIGSAKKMQK